MEQKPMHFDGSMHAENSAAGNEPFVLTDEAKMNIGKNPYSLDQGE